MPPGGGANADMIAAYTDHDEAIEPQELAFAQEDERLPWLEADDDAEEGALDTGRLVTFVLATLAILALAGGALWWVLGDHSGGKVAADGSTIAAPPGPYKTRPVKPGGSQAVGTGDTSFAVAEGKEIEGKVAETSAPPPSAPSAKPAASEAPAAKPSPSAVGVQVGAYSTHDRAEAGWSTLSARYPALSGVSHRILQATVDGSPIFRLQAVTGDLKAAQALCSTLQSQGADCQVKS